MSADRDELLTNAMFHLSRFCDWASENETMFTGWGEQIVPPGAEWWRVKANQALSALSECCDNAAHARDLSEIEYDEEGNIVNAPSPIPIVTVQEMKTSAGSDYFVHIRVGERTVTPHVFKERFKAEYEVDHWKWIFGQGEEPDLMKYGKDSNNER